MSAWVHGKLDLKCSLDVLKRAISNIMPEWANHIRTDPSGKIPLYKFDGSGGDLRAHLLLPGSGNPNYAMPPQRTLENDWGWRQADDGTWETVSADYHQGQAQDLQKKIKAEVARMRMVAIAKLRGYQTVSDTKTGSQAKMRFRVDEAQAKKLLQMV